MVLQQIHASYQLDEDRLLLRISFKEDNGDLQEIRAWVTRRLLKTLWPGIIAAMEIQVTLDQPNAAHAKSEIIGMQHEASMMEMRTRGGFDTPFGEGIEKFPFGQHPVLLMQAHISVESGQGPRIKFVSANNGHFELSFASGMLHALCKILQDATAASDWGVELRLPSIAIDQGDAQRVLN